MTRRWRGRGAWRPIRAVRARLRRRQSLLLRRLLPPRLLPPRLLLLLLLLLRQRDPHRAEKQKRARCRCCGRSVRRRGGVVRAKEDRDEHWRAARRCLGPPLTQRRRRGRALAFAKKRSAAVFAAAEEIPLREAPFRSPCRGGSEGRQRRGRKLIQRRCFRRCGGWQLPRRRLRCLRLFY